MCVSTSVYITNENYKKLETQRNINGICINKLVARLLEKTINRKKIKPKLFKPVKYQEKNYKDQKFQTLHVDLDNKLYEQCLDLRKVLKLSVSLILAISITKYLENLFIDDSATDNYKDKYVLHCFGNKNFTGYIVYWNKQTINPAAIPP